MIEVMNFRDAYKGGIEVRYVVVMLKLTVVGYVTPCSLVDMYQLFAGTWFLPHAINQCFSTSVRPWPGKFFFYKTRARSQQIYS